MDGGGIFDAFLSARYHETPESFRKAADQALKFTQDRGIYTLALITRLKARKVDEWTLC